MGKEASAAERRIDALIRAGWDVLESDFDERTFLRWRQAAYNCVRELVGAEHPYAQRLRTQINGVGPSTVLSDVGILTAAMLWRFQDFVPCFAGGNGKQKRREKTIGEHHMSTEVQIPRCGRYAYARNARKHTGDRTNPGSDSLRSGGSDVARHQHKEQDESNPHQYQSRCKQLYRPSVSRMGRQATILIIDERAPRRIGHLGNPGVAIWPISATV